MQLENILTYIGNNITIQGECFIWNGPIVKKTQSPCLRYTLGGKKYKKGVRRILSEIIYDSKDNAMYSCDNSLCVNPLHIVSGDLARFWFYVKKTNGCWIWNAATNDYGYGVFHSESGSLAHRYSYELHFGPIEDSALLVCHHCDNPPCVNPSHLFLGTHTDNSQDSINKGRNSYGEKNGQHKLTEADVIAIHLERNAGMTFQAIAKIHGVGTTTIIDVIAGRSWNHVSHL